MYSALFIWKGSNICLSHVKGLLLVPLHKDSAKLILLLTASLPNKHSDWKQYTICSLCCYEKSTMLMVARGFVTFVYVLQFC